MSVYLDIKSLYPHLKVNWNMLMCKICIARRLVVDIFPWCSANFVPFPSGTLVARRMRNGRISIIDCRDLVKNCDKKRENSWYLTEPSQYRIWQSVCMSLQVFKVRSYYTGIGPFHNTSPPPARLRLPVLHVSTKTTKIITEFTCKDPFLHLKRAN